MAHDSESECAQRARRAFAASVLHELRTPLAALAGELEIALRRTRTAAAYQEALTRVSGQAAELIELTSDLALFADPAAFRDLMGASAGLQSVLRHLSHRFDPATVAIGAAPAEIRLGGDEALLARALRLVLDHAVRYRQAGSPVRLRARLEGATPPHDGVVLVLEAANPGFSRDTWHYLLYDDLDPAKIERSGWMRLRSAAAIISMAGGSVAIDGPEEALRILIALRSRSGGPGDLEPNRQSR